MVAQYCEHELLSSQCLEENDPGGLKGLAVLMEKCLAMLEDIQEFATLNSLGTIRRIVEKFPRRMQRDWVRWSFETFKNSGNQAKFPELVQFVRNESDEANSLYGRALFNTGLKSLPESRTGRKPATVFNVTTSQPTSSVKKSDCPLCKKAHLLSECREFQRKTLYERIRFLRRGRRCFLCLEHGHQAKDCSSKMECDVEGCEEKRHHRLLHKFSSPEPEESGSEPAAQSAGVFSAAVHPCSLPAKQTSYFMTLPVRVSSKDKDILTYALLDSGSQRTFCKRDLASELGAQGPRQILSLQTLSSGSCSHDTVEGELVSLSVQGFDSDSESFQLEDVFTVESIPARAAQMPDKEGLSKLEYLRGAKYGEISDKSVGLLIGLDTPVAFRQLDSRFGPEGFPSAIKTPLGWVLFGLGPSLDALGSLSASCMLVGRTEQCSDEFLPSPSCGFDRQNSREDRISFQIMEDEIKLVDGHYQLPLLWRSKETRLLNNRSMAENWLQSLRRTLSKSESMHKRYTEVMQSYIQKGYAEAAEDRDPNKNEAVWFLPLHPVINPRKPYKLRIVFDCAAKYMGVSLNDSQMQGPDLNNSLVGVLLRFRQEPVALVSDIEGMFHQVRVEPTDRNALSFLWWPEGDLKKDPKAYRMTVHLFGATSSPSCASFCLKKTASMFGRDYSARAVEAVKRNFYVDDCLVSVPTVKEAVSLVKELNEMLLRGGFRLTKWICNNQEVIDTVPEEERASVIKTAALDASTSERVLGVHWDIDSDAFSVGVSFSQKPNTRRGILSAIHSVFDPLGWVTPLLVEPKLLLRELTNRDWDEEVTESELRR